MKLLLVVLAVLFALTGASIVVIATLVGAYTGNWTWMIVSILWFGVSLALASLALNKSRTIVREESN